MATNKKKYTVKPGDTLESLAKIFYGDQIHAESLRKINQIAPQDNVRIAMDFILPSRVASLGPIEKVEDKTVQHIYYGKLQEQANYLFPLPKEFQDKGYHVGGRSFGCIRGDRAHAGCDLYADIDTEIYAIADGLITGYYPFYWQTFALVIDHGDRVVRYGEVQPPIRAKIDYPGEFGSNPPPDQHMNGLPEGLKVGMKVKRGQHIAFVGLLRKPVGNKRINWEHVMLHFEMFKGTEPKNIELTDKKNYDKYDNVPKKTYLRRKDLLDPTSFLDATVFE
jgi:murein DD-endopeptidase MepM/ murein hydrolase activator NlpD